MFKAQLFTLIVLIVVGFFVAGPRGADAIANYDIIGGLDDCNHRAQIASTCTGSVVCNQTLFSQPVTCGVLNLLGTITPDYCNVIGCTPDGKASVTNAHDDCNTIIQ